MLAVIIAFGGIFFALKNKADQQKQATSATSTTQQQKEETAPAAESTDWKQAYISYLTEHLSQVTRENAYFSLIYLDGDDIPELVVSYNNNHSDNAKLIMMRDGQIFECESFGGWGEFQYIEKCNLLYEGYTNQGINTEIIYRITESGGYEKIWSGTLIMGISEDDFTYKSNDSEVSEDEFNRVRRTYIPDDEWIKRTNEEDDVLFYSSYTASAIASLQQFLQG